MSDPRSKQLINNQLDKLESGGFGYVFDEASGRVTFIYKADELESPKQVFLSSELKEFCGSNTDLNGNVTLKKMEGSNNIYSLTTDPLPHDLRTGYVIHTENYDFQDYENRIKVLEMPGAPKQPFVPNSEEYKLELEKMEHVDKRFILCTIPKSDDPEINKYAGKNFWIHLPKDFDKEKNAQLYPLLLLLDGHRYHTVIPTPSIMDKMMRKDEDGNSIIPSTITVLLEEAQPKNSVQPNDGEGSERFKEYDCDPGFARFVGGAFMEIVNAELKKHDVSISNDPKFRTIGGLSIGALDALYTGISTETFGHVIAQSPSVWRFGLKSSPAKENFDLALKQFRENNREIDMQITVGSLEKNAMNNGEGGKCPTMLASVGKFVSDMRKEKGITVSDSQYTGGHNYACWQGLLSNSVMNISSQQKEIIRHSRASIVGDYKDEYSTIRSKAAAKDLALDARPENNADKESKATEPGYNASTASSRAKEREKYTPLPMTPKPPWK